MQQRSGWTFGFAAAVLCGGCASEPPPPATPPPPACPAGYNFDGQQCRLIETPPGTGGAGPATPNTTGSASPTTGGTLHQTKPGPEAVRLDASAAVGAAEMLTPLLGTAVPEGAKPVGSLVAGQFTQGQSLQETIPMQPGGCYTIVGVSAPPVAELDLALTPTATLPGFNPTLAKDSDTGQSAVIGKKPHCFKWAWPAAGSMVLTITVAAGQGVAAAQVYQKL